MCQKAAGPERAASQGGGSRSPGACGGLRRLPEGAGCVPEGQHQALRAVGAGQRLAGCPLGGGQSSPSLWGGAEPPSSGRSRSSAACRGARGRTRQQRRRCRSRRRVPPVRELSAARSVCVNSSPGGNSHSGQAAACEGPGPARACAAVLRAGRRAGHRGPWTCGTLRLAPGRPHPSASTRPRSNVSSISG